VYAFIYVDDLIVAGNDSLIDDLYDKLSRHFTVSDLGELRFYLGIEFERDSHGSFLLHQAGYIHRILDRFGLLDAKPAKTPMEVGYIKIDAQREEEMSEDKELYRQAIGCLLYVATCTRPDISVSISILSRKITNPSAADWTAVKRVMRYLKGTVHFKLRLGGESFATGLIGYADADWAGDLRDRKSNSGFVFSYLGGTISWASRKQSSVALSSTEAEYMALAEACQEAMWLNQLLIDLNQSSVSTTIFEDNQSCLKILESERANLRTKHIDTKFHFVRDLFVKGIFSFVYCPTECMVADLLTKPLQAIKTLKLAEMSGLTIK